MSGEIPSGDPLPLGASRPILFLHIPKTGGHSLSQGFAQLYAPNEIFTDNGDVSADYLDQILPRAGGRAYIWGHPAPGAVTRVAGKVDVITMLRRPVDQAVSTYLFIRENPDDISHAVAHRLSLGDFLKARPQYIALQTLAIASAISADRADVVVDCDRCVKDVGEFLERMAFVGVLEELTACCRVLSERLRAEFPLQLAHLNSARVRGVASDAMATLRRDYFALRESGQFADLFAGEQATYAKASELLRRSCETLPRMAEVSIARDGVSSPSHLPGSLFVTPHGYPDGENIVCPAHSSRGYVVYGPYCCLEPGEYEVEFRFRVLDARPLGPGFLRLDVFANSTDRLSTRLVAEGGRLSAGRRTLRFRNAHREDVLEFRIGRSRLARGTVEFGGVDIRIRAP